MRRLSFLAAVALVLLGALPRLLLAAGALPDQLRPFVWSDVLFTWERGLAGGYLPYRDVYFEYPPVVGYLSGAFSLVAPSALAYVALWTATQALAAGVAAAAIARVPGSRPLVWAFAPQLALFGPANFDLLAVAAVAAALAWSERSTIGSATALALGTATKLFPAAMLPVVLARALTRRGPRGALVAAAAFAIVVVAWYAPSLGARYSSLESVGRYGTGIGANFDSFWGLVASVAAGGGLPAGEIVLALSLAGLALSYVAVVLPASLRSSQTLAPAALAVLAVLLWSRLYSPQFSLWALPFFALLPLPRRALLLLVIGDVLVFLTVYPLTLVAWSADDPVRTALIAALAAAVALRQVALLAAFLAARRLAGAPWV